MPRSISVTRRKPDLIDLFINRRAGVTGFQFSVADNFDSALTVFQEISIYGYASPSVIGNATINKYAGAIGNQYRNKTRFVFAPSDYTASVAAMRDDKPIYLSIKQRNADGSLGAAEALHMIVPPPWPGRRPIMLRGTVPLGVNIAASLEIQLPMSCYDWEIQNGGAADMYIAFERGVGTTTDPEFRLPPATSVFRSLEQYATNISQIFLRGSGASTIIDGIFTARNEEL